MRAGDRLFASYAVLSFRGGSHRSAASKVLRSFQARAAVLRQRVTATRAAGTNRKRFSLPATHERCLSMTPSFAAPRGASIGRPCFSALRHRCFCLSLRRAAAGSVELVTDRVHACATLQTRGLPAATPKIRSTTAGVSFDEVPPADW